MERNPRGTSVCLLTSLGGVSRSPRHLSLEDESIDKTDFWFCLIFWLFLGVCVVYELGIADVISQLDDRERCDLNVKGSETVELSIEWTDIIKTRRVRPNKFDNKYI